MLKWTVFHYVQKFISVQDIYIGKLVKINVHHEQHSNETSVTYYVCNYWSASVSIVKPVGISFSNWNSRLDSIGCATPLRCPCNVLDMTVSPSSVQCYLLHFSHCDVNITQRVLTNSFALITSSLILLFMGWEQHRRGSYSLQCRGHTRLTGQRHRNNSCTFLNKYRWSSVHALNQIPHNTFCFRIFTISTATVLLDSNFIEKYLHRKNFFPNFAISKQIICQLCVIIPDSLQQVYIYPLHTVFSIKASLLFSCTALRILTTAIWLNIQDDIAEGITILATLK